MFDPASIFSTDTTDLPESCKNNLKIFNIRDDAKNLLKLFDIKHVLTIDEIVMGLYRVHKTEKSRVWISSTLYNLGRRNLVRKVDGEKCLYEKAY